MFGAVEGQVLKVSFCGMPGVTLFFARALRAVSEV